MGYHATSLNERGLARRDEAILWGRWGFWWVVFRWSEHRHESWGDAACEWLYESCSTFTTSNGNYIRRDTTCRCYFSVDNYGNLFVDPVKEGSYSSSFLPATDGSNPLGGSGWRWQAVYAVNGTIQTSNSKEKDSVPLPYGINKILQVRTIKYKWKTQADLPDDDPAKNFEYYGFCADELSPLFPELVYDENKEAPVQMSYTELLPVVVNALKEEHASAVALKATVESQAEQITSLQQQLASLTQWTRAQGFSG